MVPIKYLQSELLIDKTQAKLLATGRMNNAGKIKRSLFIDLIVNEFVMM